MIISEGMLRMCVCVASVTCSAEQPGVMQLCMQSCEKGTLSRSSSCEVLLALPVTTMVKRSLMAANPYISNTVPRKSYYHVHHTSVLQ